MEKRALEQVLKEIENQQINKIARRDKNDEENDEQNFHNEISNSRGGWPPDKYRHVKGSGYGTSWSPSTYLLQKSDQKSTEAKLKKPINKLKQNQLNKSEKNNNNNINKSITESNINAILEMDEKTQIYILKLKSINFKIIILK